MSGCAVAGTTERRQTMNKKTIAMIVTGALIAVAAFAGGYVVSSNRATTKDPRAAFAKLSEADRASMANMTAEQRQAFLKEKGIDMPAGGPGGTADGTANGAIGMGRGPGGGNQVLEGTVASIDGEKVSLTLSAGGSAKVYVDGTTVVAATTGKTAEVTKGATVIVIAKPEATGVDVASTVVVK